MTATPLHIHHHDHGLGVVGLVMSAHTLGMFALAPVVGWLVDRTGGMKVAMIGMGVLAAASLGAAFGPNETTGWLVATLWLLGIGFIVFLAVSLANHASAGTLPRLFNPLSSGTFMLSVVYLGIVSSLGTSLTANYILSKMEASKMSVFANLATIVSMAAGAMFLGEKVTMYHLIGSLLIIAGVIGTNRLGRKRAVEKALKAS